MKNSSVYYSHSGRVGPVGFPLLIASGLLSSAVLSVAYSLAIHYIPFVYLDAIMPFVFGAGMGYGICWGVKTGHVRNSAAALVVAFASGVIGIYLSWVGALFILSGFEVLVFDPLALIGFIQGIAVDGVWSLKSWTPTGWALYAFWIAEAAIVILYPIIHVSNYMGECIYCEKTGKWTDEEEVVGPFESISDPDSFRARIESGDYSQLLNMKKIAESADFSAVVFKGASDCSDFHLFSIKNVSLSTNDKGEVKTKEAYVAKHVLSNREITDSIKNILVSEPVASPSSVSPT